MKLLRRVDDFNHEAFSHVAEPIVNDQDEAPDVEVEDDLYLELLDEEMPPRQGTAPIPRLRAENKKLMLPSTLGLEVCMHAGIEALVEKEFKLRNGQANDALQGVRSALGEKSFLYRSDLRLANSKVKKTRSWKKLMAVNKKLNFHRWVYNKARNALIALKPGDPLLEVLLPLEQEQLRVSTAIFQPNAPGQRNITLAWFWNLNIGPRDENDNLLAEGRGFCAAHFYRTHRVSQCTEYTI